MSPNTTGTLPRGSWQRVGSPVSEVVASLHLLCLCSEGLPRSPPSVACSWLATLLGPPSHRADRPPSPSNGKKKEARDRLGEEGNHANMHESGALIHVMLLSCYFNSRFWRAVGRLLFFVIKVLWVIQGSSWSCSKRMSHEPPQ
jgi:hypothetical protein